MNKNVLITGGTGNIGSRLTELLLLKGFSVSHLSRSPGKGTIKTYLWDVDKNFIDKEAIANADYIIHLAGTGVFDKKWTKDFKEDIIDSRVKTAELLVSMLKTVPNKVQAFVSASGISYYGVDTGDVVLDELAPPGKDFISDVVIKWESAVNEVSKLGIRLVKLRIGIVFSRSGGALRKLTNPIRKGVGAVLGSGKQVISWIHEDDVCLIFIKALVDENLQGVYNAVSPNPASNEIIIKESAAVLQKAINLPSVPPFALKLLLGSERAGLVLGGNWVSNKKIAQAGYKYKYPDLKVALNSLLK